jgi:hypothetical protein
MKVISLPIRIKFSNLNIIYHPKVESQRITISQLVILKQIAILIIQIVHIITTNYHQQAQTHQQNNLTITTRITIYHINTNIQHLPNNILHPLIWTNASSQ